MILSPRSSPAAPRPGRRGRRAQRASHRRTRGEAGQRPGRSPNRGGAMPRQVTPSRPNGVACQRRCPACAGRRLTDELIPPAASTLARMGTAALRSNRAALLPLVLAATSAPGSLLPAFVREPGPGLGDRFGRLSKSGSRRDLAVSAVQTASSARWPWRRGARAGSECDRGPTAPSRSRASAACRSIARGVSYVRGRSRKRLRPVYGRMRPAS
jgi:hypothetical protein